MDAGAVDPDIGDPRTLRGVIGARMQRLQQRLRMQALGADLDPGREAIAWMKPVRVVAHGDVQAGELP
jgi:hypothetical protein